MPSRIFRIGRSHTGLGMFATKPIMRGGYIATYRGRRISNKEADRRERLGAKYMFELNRRWTIDGSPRWNVARYINHSCRPNCKPVTRKGRIVIVAKRPIKPEEEITYHYGREYLEYFINGSGCRCAFCRARRARKRREARRRRAAALRRRQSARKRKRATPSAEKAATRRKKTARSQRR
jgi:SET domain-containing protein